MLQHQISSKVHKTKSTQELKMKNKMKHTFHLFHMYCIYKRKIYIHSSVFTLYSLIEAMKNIAHFTNTMYFTAIIPTNVKDAIFISSSFCFFCFHNGYESLLTSSAVFFLWLLYAKEAIEKEEDRKKKKYSTKCITFINSFFLLCKIFFLFLKKTRIQTLMWFFIFFLYIPFSSSRMFAHSF